MPTHYKASIDFRQSGTDGPTVALVRISPEITEQLLQLLAMRMPELDLGGSSPEIVVAVDEEKFRFYHLQKGRIGHIEKQTTFSGASWLRGWASSTKDMEERRRMVRSAAAIVRDRLVTEIRAIGPAYDSFSKLLERMHKQIQHIEKRMAELESRPEMLAKANVVDVLKENVGDLARRLSELEDRHIDTDRYGRPQGVRERALDDLPERVRRLEAGLRHNDKALTDMFHRWSRLVAAVGDGHQTEPVLGEELVEAHDEEAF